MSHALKSVRFAPLKCTVKIRRSEQKDPYLKDRINRNKLLADMEHWLRKRGILGPTEYLVMEKGKVTDIDDMLITNMVAVAFIKSEQWHGDWYVRMVK